MEVSGRKVFNEQTNLLCKPCEESKVSTRADGLCRECKEHMCKPCFDTHKKYKLNRGHTLTNSDETVAEKEQAEDFERCDQHSSEMIKFYCPLHEQVGCGDCMILEHKTCKVEYIRDKARMFTDSQEFKTLVKGAQNYRNEAQEMTTSIKNNKKQVVDVNEKFSQDVNLFKEEMISHINKLTDAMLKQGEHIKANNIKSMEELENENKIITLKISRLTETFESQIDQPQKLFVSSILQKPKLNQLREQLDSMQARNKIEIYEFQRNKNLEDSVKDGNQLGSIQNVKSRNEIDVQEGVRAKKRNPLVQVPVPTEPQRGGWQRPPFDFMGPRGTYPLPYRMAIPPQGPPQSEQRPPFPGQLYPQQGGTSPSKKGDDDNEMWRQKREERIQEFSTAAKERARQRREDEEKDMEMKIIKAEEKLKALDELKVEYKVSVGQSPGPREVWGLAEPMYEQIHGTQRQPGMIGTSHSKSYSSFPRFMQQPVISSTQTMAEQMRPGQGPPSPSGPYPWGAMPTYPLMGYGPRPPMDMQGMPVYPGVRRSWTDSHGSGTDSQEEA